MLQIIGLSLLNLKMIQGILLMSAIVTFLYMEIFFTIHSQVNGPYFYEFVFFEWFHFIIFFITLKLFSLDFLYGTIKVLLTGALTKGQVFLSKLLSISMVTFVFWLMGYGFKVVLHIKNNQALRPLEIINHSFFSSLWPYLWTGWIISLGVWSLAYWFKSSKRTWQTFILIYVPYYFVLGSHLNPSKGFEANVFHVLLRHTPGYLIFKWHETRSFSPYELAMVLVWGLVLVGLLLLIGKHDKRSPGYLRSH